MLIYLLIILTHVTNLQSSLLSDINSLSELPLQKLIQVKNSLDVEKHEEITIEAKAFSTEESTGRQYTALFHKKPSKKSLAMIFQMSVTALAFLAFGGYLLCLLVQALKHKHSYTDSLLYSSPIRKRPVFRARRSTWQGSDPDKMFYALKMFSEGFATYSNDCAYNQTYC